MDSTAPTPDEGGRSQANGLSERVSRLEDAQYRLEQLVGDGSLDGMRGEIRSIAKAQIEAVKVLFGVRDCVWRIQEELRAHIAREAERRVAEEKRCAELARKVDDGRRTGGYVLASNATLFVMLAWLLARGC